MKSVFGGTAVQCFIQCPDEGPSAPIKLHVLPYFAKHRMLQSRYLYRALLPFSYRGSSKPPEDVGFSGIFPLALSDENRRLSTARRIGISSSQGRFNIIDVLRTSSSPETLEDVI